MMALWRIQIKKEVRRQKGGQKTKNADINKPKAETLSKNSDSYKILEHLHNETSSRLHDCEILLYLVLTTYNKT